MTAAADGRSQNAILAALLRDYKRELDQGHYADDIAADPLMMMLLRMFSARLAELYIDDDARTLKLLDELSARLSVDLRHVTAAQMILRLTRKTPGEIILRAGTEVTVDGNSGQKLSFASDESYCVSQARIAMAFIYQKGQLRPACLGDWANRGVVPREEMTPVNWGDSTSILLAIDNLPPTHLLGGLSVLVQSKTNAPVLNDFLQRSVWRIADAAGRFGAGGTHRPRKGPGGITRLTAVFASDGTPVQSERDDSEREFNWPGFYAGSVYVFPLDAGSAGGGQCSAPFGLEPAMLRLLAPATDALTAKRFWLRIALPPDANEAGMDTPHDVVTRLALHAMSFSNLECLNLTIEHDKDGLSIPIEFPGTHRKMVGLRALLAGDSASLYHPVMDASAPPGSGRYYIREGRLRFIPPGWMTPEAAKKTNVRIWMTSGSVANDRSTGLQKELRFEDGTSLQIMLLEPSRGGRDFEDLSTAEARFASSILSRGRIVTQADLLAAVRAFDSRIIAASAKLVSRRTDTGLQMVQEVAISFRNAEFSPATDPESSFIKQALENELRRRLPLDVGVDVVAGFDRSKYENQDLEESH